MKIKRSVNALFLAWVLALSLCGCTKKIKIGGEKITEDATQLNCVLTAEDIAQLDQLPLLHYLDLSGSDCYEEIVRWGERHEEVELHYTLAFPGGNIVPNDARTMKLSNLRSSDMQETIRLIGYLSDLNDIDLSGSALSAEDIALLKNTFPQLKVDYSFELLGQTVSFETQEVDLTDITEEEIYQSLGLLSALPELRLVHLGDEHSSPLSWELLAKLARSCPGAELDYRFTLYGKDFNLSDRNMDINHIFVGDEGEQIYRVMACMNRLEYLDMDFCGVSNEGMERIRKAYPDVDVVWRIWLGEKYSVRTDVEKILVSKPSVGGNLTDAMIQPLKYCTRVKYLDIGHNEGLTDLSFAYNMPELEVLVAAMNQIRDLSPLAACEKLEYLEIQTNPITDLSPLAACRNLAHLNCARNGGITDVSALFSLKKLERLWLGSSTKCPQEQLDEILRINPDCEINTTVFNDPTEGRWRYIGSNPAPWSVEVYLHPRYELLCEQFGYLTEDYSFAWKDPKYEKTE